MKRLSLLLETGELSWDISSVTLSLVDLLDFVLDQRI